MTWPELDNTICGWMTNYMSQVRVERECGQGAKGDQLYYYYYYHLKPLELLAEPQSSCRRKSWIDGQGHRHWFGSDGAEIESDKGWELIGRSFSLATDHHYILHRRRRLLLSQFTCLILRVWSLRFPWTLNLILVNRFKRLRRLNRFFHCL